MFRSFHQRAWLQKQLHVPFTVITWFIVVSHDVVICEQGRHFESKLLKGLRFHRNYKITKVRKTGIGQYTLFNRYSSLHYKTIKKRTGNNTLVQLSNAYNDTNQNRTGYPRISLIIGRVQWHSYWYDICNGGLYWTKQFQSN